MSSHPALEECLVHVTDSAPLALERCLDHVVSVLQQAEGVSLRTSERTELGEAWRELLGHKRLWCQRYPAELRAAFNSASVPVTAPAATRTPPERSSSDITRLALLPHDDVTQSIEAARLVQHVRPLVEQPVSELDALLSAALGLATIRPELNPVRPEVFAQTLRSLVRRSEVKAATGSLWLKHMADPLALELQDLYGDLVTRLKASNVQALEFSHRPASAVRLPGTLPGADGPQEPMQTPASRAVGAGTIELSRRQISAALLRDFALHGDPQRAGQALPASYYAEAERELSALSRAAADSAGAALPTPVPPDYREMPVVERPARPVGVRSSLDVQAWGRYAASQERSLVLGRLRRDASRVGQVLGLELVRRVVDGVAQDPRLLAPMREAIVALEPSLLRLAMVDPRFLSEHRHPGRVLMERTALRSFKYNDEFSAEFEAFLQHVKRSFNELNDLEIESAEPFEEQYLRLEALWEQDDREHQEQRRTAVDAVRFAEQRHAETDQIAWELSSRADLDGVPEVVQDFLFGPWTVVLAHARLSNANRDVDPGGYQGVITNLLWSVKREVTLRQPVQLFERLPPLLAKLREGLASVGYQPEEHEPFFQELMKLHHPVLRLRRAKSRRNARESGMAPLAFAAPTESPQPLLTGPARTAPDQPWMSQRELDAAGFQDTLPTDLGGLDAAPADRCQDAAAAESPRRAEDHATGSPVAPNVELVLAQLQEGDWVDLYSKQQWLRAQLIWASSKGTLFMFVSHAGRPHSMTRRICERLIRERYLRPVRRHGVVAQALDSLEQESRSSGPAALDS